MVRVKGAVIISIRNFIKTHFPNKYDEFIESLPEETKVIMQSSKLIDWYDINIALKTPTKIICDKFYSGSVKGAWKMGRQSAKFTLNGIYKIFVKVGSAAFVLGRASHIFSAYYNPSQIELTESKKKEAILTIRSFEDIDTYIENRIGGWIECALEINGLKNPKVTITSSLSKGNDKTIYQLSWE
ncbi:hypothetical protein J7L48_11380 [bacterium]|nr:hypothetical protein [bacterium]